MARVVGGFFRARGRIPPHTRKTKGSPPYLPDDGDARATLAHAIPVADTANVDELLNAIGAHFRRQRNIALSCVQCEERKQQHGETFDRFFVGLKELAADADLCATCLDARLITRIMSGVRSEALRKKLLAIDPFPALKDVLAVCRAEESAEHTDADLTWKPSVKAASCSRRPEPSTSKCSLQQSGHPHVSQEHGKCKYCGGRSHKTRTDCPAYGTTCTSCGKKHHFAAVCRSQKSHGQVPGQSSSFRHHVQSVESISPRERQCPRVNVLIATGTFSHSRNLGEFLATPDTGADVTIMGRIQFDLLGFTRDQLDSPLGQEVLAANGQPLDCLGTLNLIFHLGSRSVADRVTVVDSVDGIFLAWYVAQDLGILPDNYPTPLPPHTKATRLQVNSCQVRQPSKQKEPTDPLPRRVFEVASADFFTHAGHTYLVYADRLSGWMEIAQLPSTAACSTIRTLAAWFCRLGIPTTLGTDNGPPFNSHNFHTFLNRWGVTHAPSSPHYPQPNSHAEATVTKVKLLLRKSAPEGDITSTAFQKGLLELRNMPDASGRSPAQIVFGHSLLLTVPAHHTTSATEWSTASDRLDQRAADLRDAAISTYNRSGKPLGPLQLGATVRVQDSQTKLWDKIATVISIGQHRTYRVRLASGRVLWRNRRFLRVVPAAPTSSPAENQPSSDTSDQAPRRSTRTRNAPTRLTM